MNIFTHHFTFTSLIAVLFFCSSFAAPEHCNLFEPYEWLLDPVRLSLFPSSSEHGVNLGIRVEQAFKVSGHMSDDEDCFLDQSPQRSRKVNALQYLQDHENIFSAFLGNSFDTAFGSFAQQFTPFEGATANGIALVNGKVSYGNIVGSLEYWVSDHLRLGWYLPYYWIHLSDVTWAIPNGTCFFEQTLNNNLLNVVQENGKLDIGNFTRNGLGDSSLLLSWQDSFMEKRDFVTGITCALRGGAHLPTRSALSDCKAEDTLLRLHLGYDCSWGILCGGSLALDLGNYVTSGISADFTKFFGDIAPRRIKTDTRQTDLLLLVKEQCFIDPGFKQQFVLYADLHTFSKDAALTLAYCYTKQNESDIILCSADYVQRIASTMQRLEAWSIHNIILQLQKQQNNDTNDMVFGCFIKGGFSGERSLAGVNIGATFSYMF